MLEYLVGEPTISYFVSHTAVLLATGEQTVNIGTDNVFIQVIILALSVGMVAFFSSAEASLISVNKFRIRYLAENGNRAAQSVNRVLSRHEKFSATILLTENAFIIFASSVGAAMAINLVGGSEAAILMSTLVMIVFIVIFGEITPKALAAGASERWSLIIARPIELVMLAETFIIYLFTLVPRGITRLMRYQGHVWGPSVTEGELRMLIDISRAEGSVAPREASLLEKVFRFGDQQVREAMTPRTEIIWIAKDTSLNSFLELYADNSHTRFPVYDGTYENVIGILSNKDVLLAMGKGQLKPEDSVTGLLRTAYFVPETKLIADTFAEMQQYRHSLLLAVDEFGSIAGLATRKQLLGVFVGVAGDDDNLPDEDYTPIDEDTFNVTAGMNISEINEKLGLSIPEGEYQTIAGFILDQLGYIPDSEEVLEYQNLKITIKKMNGVRIETVELRRLPAALDEVVE